MPNIHSKTALLSVFKRFWRWLPFIGFPLLFIGTTVFAFLGGLDESSTLFQKITHHAALILCFLCLWVAVARLVRNSRPTPIQTFWQTILAILGGSFAAFLAFQIPGDFIDSNPAASIVHVKSALLSAVLAGLSFFIVHRLGLLVRFRRTRRSERNWRFMIILIGVASLSSIPTHHQFEPYFDWPFGIAVYPFVALSLASVIFILMNSVRLAWIVRLSLREKRAAIGLGIAIVALLVSLLVAMANYGSLVSSTTATVPNVFLHFFSYPLFAATSFFFLFGLIYALTSVLSLIFHLPTTGDYRRSTDEMAAMQTLAGLLREVVESEKLYQWAVSTPVESGHANMAWLTVQNLDSGSLTPDIVASCNIESDRIAELCDVTAIHNSIVQTREPVLIQDTLIDARTRKSKSGKFESLLAIPLTTRTEVLAVLFASRDVIHAFEGEDIETIGVFASQATLVLENARLLEAKIERERLANELAIARDVQQRLLPQSMPELPNLNLAASSVAAHEVGGDYFDILELDEGELAFIVADVSGKGTSAAFYMAEMQGIFQAVARIESAPDIFLGYTNRALGESLEKNIFVTAVYGTLNSHSGRVSLARAGHTPAVLVDADGNAKLLHSEGLGIGLDRGELFGDVLEVEHIQLRPDDLLVLYTDGVIESRNNEGEEFGYDRLLQTVQGAHNEDAQGVHDAIRQTVDEFAGTNERYDDDLTLLIIKWHGRKTLSGGTAQTSLS
ncbi:MAG: SpoIIE family protein phosphatase [Rhodothermaceae bacterium]|nr:SpoIIE family protein phosphatase [Rhodothermaceae bacterium]